MREIDISYMTVEEAESFLTAYGRIFDIIVEGGKVYVINSRKN